MSQKSDILLSIGMIVKNEEQNLPRCLDSLKPIMESLPCQLIITDTGSTDQTIAIAKKYTEEVYSFEWCDDFAAARNFGLEKAKGEWFMFIDADEWFEDCSEIIEFFKSGEYRKYANATYKIRNYVNHIDKSNYEECIMGRMYEINERTKFVGIIHESISLTLPIKELNSFIHHYGYATDNSVQFRKNKTQRNLLLLEKEYKANPNDMRLAYLISKEYASKETSRQYRKHIRKIYEDIKNDYNNEYLPYFVYQLALIEKDENNLKIGLDILKKYIKGQKNKEIWNLDILVAMVDLYVCMGEHKNALKYAKHYFAMFELYTQGKLETGVSGIVAHTTFSTIESSVTVYNLMCKAYLEMDDCKSALDIVESLDYTRIVKEDLKTALRIFFYSVSRLGLWNHIPELYLNFLSNNINKNIECFREIIEEALLGRPQDFKDIVFAFNDCIALHNEYKDDKYLLLQNLRLGLIKNSQETTDLAKEFLKLYGDKEILPQYAEFVLYALLLSTWSERVISQIDIENISNYTHKLSSLYEDLEDIIVPLIHDYNTGDSLVNHSLKYSYWLMCLLEIVILKMRVDSIDDRKNQVIDEYITYSFSYMERVYDKEVLSLSNIDILPKAYQFIFYAYHAQEELKVGNRAISIELLKKAVRAYPVMVNMVSELLKKVEKTDDREKSKIEQMTNKIEFDFYAKTIKRKIEEMAQGGMQEEAIELLERYIQINSSDKQGIKELRHTLKLDN